MKIAVSATGPDLSSEVDPRFGRCQYLIFVETDTMDFESISNASAGASGGAGIATGQTVVNKDVQAVLTGNVGPKAHNVLAQAGIQIMTGVSGSIRQAVEEFNNGKLKATSGPTVEEHAGMKPPAQNSATQPDVKGEIETLKGRANTMKQQLDNLMFRIEELEKRA